MALAKLVSIIGRQLPPTPWVEGDNIPWQDPAFSERMLVEHLSQEHDLASRRTLSIEAHVHFIERQLPGLDHAHILDLGCGPGLYLHRLARRGHCGHGIDFSPAAINHARSVAAREELDCHFEQADLRHADFGEGFDLVLLLYGQINVFTRQHARDILQRAHAALAANVLSELGPQLRGKRCQAHSSDLRVRVLASGLATYPDVTVVAGHAEPDPEDANTVVNPLVVVEVT